MGEDQVEGRLAEPAMKVHGLVVTEGAVDHWHPRSEHQHENDQVRADQAADHPDAGDGIRHARKTGGTPLGEEQRDNDCDRHPAEHLHQVGAAHPTAIAHLDRSG